MIYVVHIRFFFLLDENFDYYLILWNLSGNVNPSAEFQLII